MAKLTLTNEAVRKVLDDHYAASGDDSSLHGTLVETDYGLLWLSPGMPILATGGPIDGWNYAWVLLDDLNDEDFDFTAQQVWDSAARSTRRVDVRVECTFTYQWGEGGNSNYTPSNNR